MLIHGRCQCGNIAFTLGWEPDPGEIPARTRTAEFHVCVRCGVVPVVTSLIDGRLYAVVNVNAFEGVDPSLLRHVSAHRDDETREDRLARRKHHWIADVDYLEMEP